MSTLDLAGYKFYSPDASAIIHAALKALIEGTRYSLLVHGPAGCGKSRLVKQILSAVSLQPRNATFPREEKMIAAYLRCAVKSSSQFVWLEDFGRKRRQRRWLQSDSLNALLTSDTWTFRKYRSQEMITAAVNLLTILTVNTDYLDDISADLRARFNVVTMFNRCEVEPPF